MGIDELFGAFRLNVEGGLSSTSSGNDVAPTDSCRPKAPLGWLVLDDMLDSTGGVTGCSGSSDLRLLIVVAYHHLHTCVPMSTPR